MKAAAFYLKLFALWYQLAKLPRLKTDEKFAKQYAALATDLAYFLPQTKALSLVMVSVDKQYTFADDSLNQSLQNANIPELTRQASNHVLEQVRKIQQTDKAAGGLLAEVSYCKLKGCSIALQPLDQNDEEFREAFLKREEYRRDYLSLSVKLKEYSWGRLVASAMLGLSFALVVGCACATGFGCTLAIPIISWGLASLIPATLGSCLGFVASFSIFAKTLAKDRERQALAQAHG